MTALTLIHPDILVARESPGVTWNHSVSAAQAPMVQAVLTL